MGSLLRDSLGLSPVGGRPAQFAPGKHRPGCAFTLSVVLWAALCSTGTLAQQSSSNRLIRLIISFPPGGASRALGRIIGPPLTEAFGQPVVIENRPGTGTNIGAEIAAKSLPDGYTLFMGSISHTINVTLYNKLNYDFVRGFAPVTMVASNSCIGVVHPSVPAKSMKKLIALAKARPRQLSYASAGSGTLNHLPGEMLKSTLA